MNNIKISGRWLIVIMHWEMHIIRSVVVNHAEDMEDARYQAFKACYPSYDKSVFGSLADINIAPEHSFPAEIITICNPIHASMRRIAAFDHNEEKFVFGGDIAIHNETWPEDAPSFVACKEES